MTFKSLYLFNTALLGVHTPGSYGNPKKLEVAWLSNCDALYLLNHNTKGIL